MSPREIKAYGQLAHHFHGKYWATIALIFPTKQEAASVLQILVGKWTQKENGLVSHCQDEELKEIKRLLVAYGADEKKIDCMSKSVDFSPKFHCTFYVD